MPSDRRLQIIVIQVFPNLLYVDLPRLRCTLLRHHDAQDAILETSFDAILIHTRRERKRAVEFAHTAFTNPIPRLLGIVLLADIFLSRSCGHARLSTLILDARLVCGINFLLFLCALDEALRPLALFAAVLVAPGDGQRVVVGPLDVDVLLLDAGEFAVEFVDFLGLFNVEFGREGAHVFELAVQVAEGLAVVFVEETEDGREFLREAWEERHCVWRCGQCACGDWFADAVEVLWNASSCCADCLHGCFDLLCSADGLWREGQEVYILKR